MDTAFYLLPENFFSVGEKPYAGKFSQGKPLSDIDINTYRDTQNYTDINSKTQYPCFFYWPTPSVKEAFLYIYSMANCCFGKKFHVERKDADSFFMALTYKGHGKLKYENSEYDLFPGDLFLIDCRKHHAYYTEEQEWGYYGIYFDGAPMSVFFAYLQKYHSYRFFIEDNTPLFLSLRQLFHINSERTALTEIENNQAMTYIMTEIVHMVHSQALTPDKIKAVCEFLDKHYMEQISLDLLADRFFISKYHLSHLFLQYVHMPPNTYLNMKRINMAKYYLVTTELSIQDIAAMVGIHSSNHFLYLFKRYENMKPTEFRRKYSLKEDKKRYNNGNT